MSTPPVTLSLMVTNAEELATMLAVLNQHDKRMTDNDRDLLKHARAERDEALSTATGWKQAAERRNADYVELAQHAESLAQQLEAIKATPDYHMYLSMRAERNDARAERDDARVEMSRWERYAKELEGQRDKLSELLQAANEKLDGGRNKPIRAQCPGTENGLPCAIEPPHPGKHMASPQAIADEERHRLLGGVADLQGKLGPAAEAQRRDNDTMARAVEQLRAADLHPDEDPRH